MRSLYGRDLMDPENGEVILVSACLVGVECNHLGRSNTSPAVVAMRARGARLVSICPEVAGGLPIPRAAAEIQADGSVRTAGGDDVTDAYRAGAAAAVSLATASGARRAVLKARSPSCGCHEVYDGTFSRTTRVGQGITAAALRAAGIEVVSEEDLTEPEG